MDSPGLPQVTLQSLYQITSHLRQPKDRYVRHLLPEEEVWVRLKPATIGFFKFRSIWKEGSGYCLSVGHLRNNKRITGGVYMPSRPDALVVIDGLQIPVDHQQPDLDFWNLHAGATT